tara:strand:- start:20826 stop:22085 length:1260 start_codon:yes stop_codon:yes gene_type:complete
MNFYKILAICIFFLASLPIAAQKSIPVINAVSKMVDITDGEHYKKGVWQILPERNPDFYYVSFPKKPHKVTFHTDIDSISFNTSYGNSYDFYIVLKNGDSCLTRIMAIEKELLKFHRSSKTIGSKSDTIPIKIGENSKIHFTGSINSSEPLNFQFDLGSGGCGINENSIDKVKFFFDDKTFLINSKGRNEVATSSKNTLNVGSLTWDNNITFIESNNLEKGEDGILGNSLFMDKVIEIDYDKEIMIIHDSLPEYSENYVKQSYILDGVIPHIKGDIISGVDKFTDWFMFDTGYAGILKISQGFSEKFELPNKSEKTFNPFDDILILEGLTIGEHKFSNVSTHVYSKVGGTSGAIIGNKILKYFNVIIDNRNGFIYFKKNGLIKKEHSVFSLLLYVLLSAVIIALVFVFLRFKKWKGLKL